MTPRLKSSKKWTAFPEEYRSQIEEVFKQEFAEKMGADTKLVIDGRIYPEEILLRVGLQKKGQLRQDNFEVSAVYSVEAGDAVERIGASVDAAASMMADHFELEEVEFPRTWTEYEFDGKSIYLQYSTENTDLEKAANELLGEEAKALVYEDEDSDDALDLSEPTMFSGKKKKEDMH